MYPLEDRVLIVKLYYENKGSFVATIRKFGTTRKINEIRNLPDRHTVLSLIKKFELHGTVHDLAKPGRKKSNELNEVVQPQTSTNEVTRVASVSQSLVHKVLRKQLGLHPFKLSVAQALTVTSKACRTKFVKI